MSRPGATPGLKVRLYSLDKAMQVLRRTFKQSYFFKKKKTKKEFTESLIASDAQVPTQKSVVFFVVFVQSRDLEFFHLILSSFTYSYFS